LIIPLDTRIINVTGIEPTKIIEHATKISLLSIVNTEFLSNYKLSIIDFRFSGKSGNSV